MEDWLIQLLFIAGVGIIQLLVRALKSEPQPEHQPQDLAEDLDDDLDDSEDMPWAGPPAATSLPRPEVPAVAARLAAQQAALLDRTSALVTRASALLESARLDRATRRPAQVIEQYILPRASALQAHVSGENFSPDFARARLDNLAFVLATVTELIEQRRLPGLREPLGDVDELARACYEPVLDFARVNQLPLTSAHPLAILGPFDLSIWVGFIPTGVAPVFLPRDFFDNLRWWPAIAHEIGHDFLAATSGAETRLRAQLGLPSEVAGTQPIYLPQGTRLPMRELVRLFGAWFEEIFCDLFGTMMLGPAYGYTMVALFAEPATPERVARVGVAPGGGSYDVHPPRHLRVRLCARALRLMDEDKAADEILASWTEIHGDQPELLLPTLDGTLAVPMEVVEDIGDQILTTLYREGLDGLDGHSLSDIPGLDHGPHEAAEARRVAEELLAGRPPVQHKARAVVAGAILAWHQAPAREAELLALARRALVGVSESRAAHHAAAVARRGQPTPHELREAFLLHTILTPPRSVQRMRPNARSLLSRPRLPGFPG